VSLYSQISQYLAVDPEELTISPRRRLRGGAASSATAANAINSLALTLTVPDTLLERDAFWFEAITGDLSLSLIASSTLNTFDLSVKDAANNKLKRLGQFATTTITLAGQGGAGFQFSPIPQLLTQNDLATFARLAGFAGTQPYTIRLDIVFTNGPTANQILNALLEVMYRKVSGINEA